MRAVIDVLTNVALRLVKEHPWQSPHDAWGGKPPVVMSDDLARVLALPRRAQELDGTDRAETIIDVMTERFGKGTKRCRCREIDPDRECVVRLRLVQALALRDLGICGGLFGPIAVGVGKCHGKHTELFDYQTAARRSVTQAGTLEVATYERGLRLASAVAFPSGIKDSVRVLLADGCSAEPSRDHPYLTHHGWVDAGELQPGIDFVAVAVQMPEPARVTVASDAEITMVAYMLSDGGCSQGSMNFTNATPAIIKEWCQLSSVVGSGYSIQNVPGQRSKAGQYRLLGAQASQSGFRERWDLHGLSRNKRTHPSIWGLPRRQVALFLNRFWACDGHVSQRGVECTLASEKLIDDLRFLGSRLGIRFRKHFKKSSYMKDGARRKFDSWRIVASGDNASRFLDEVGDILGKEDACHQLRASFKRTARNPNVDVVPIGVSEIQQICDELGMPRRGGDRRHRIARPRSEVQAFLHPTAGQFISRARFIEFCQQWNYIGKYAHLATTDVAWERVVSVVDIGPQPVFDLTVPVTHNFVANGMVVHNTAIDLLAPLALAEVGIRLCVLLVPAALVTQLVGDYEFVGQHFRMPSIVFHGNAYSAVVPGAPVLHVVPYSRLCRPEATAWLEHQLKPEAIIADEVHKLRRTDTATGSRVDRFMEAHPETRFAGWSGSITAKSLRDYDHLAKWALRGASPLPLVREVTDDWCRALDPSDNPADPGPLMRLCEPGENVVSGYRRRLVETVGVVTSTAPAVDCELSIEERPAPPIPESVRVALESVRNFVRPDGEELVDALSMTKAAREVALGFYYHWIFPHNVFPRDENLVYEWLDARKEWHKELRVKLRSREEHLDSPMLGQHAAERAWGDRPQHKGLPTWKAVTWPRWREIKHRVQPETEAIRLDDYLARDAAAWAAERPGVVWYEHHAFGEWVAELGGLPMYGGGANGGGLLQADPPHRVLERGDRSIVLSIKAHGTGRNGLQYIFADQLVSSLPSAQGCEQMLGRLHRFGQRAACVHTHFYRHTEEMQRHLDDALQAALYVEGTLGSVQKLRMGFVL